VSASSSGTPPVRSLDLKPNEQGFRYVLMWMDFLLEKNFEADQSYLIEWRQFVADCQAAANDHENLKQLYGAVCLRLQALGEKAVPLTPYSESATTTVTKDYAVAAIHRAASSPSSAIAPCWHPISETPPGWGIYVARDRDGQMTFANFSELYGWEHACDENCGMLLEWTPLPPCGPAK
jgi:hypothetical protein